MFKWTNFKSNSSYLAFLRFNLLGPPKIMNALKFEHFISLKAYLVFFTFISEVMG